MEDPFVVSPLEPRLALVRAAEVRQLVQRLEETLASGAPPPARHHEFERRRYQGNIDYARETLRQIHLAHTDPPNDPNSHPAVGLQDRLNHIQNRLMQSSISAQDSPESPPVNPLWDQILSSPPSVQSPVQSPVQRQLHQPETTSHSEGETLNSAGNTLTSTAPTPSPTVHPTPNPTAPAQNPTATVPPTAPQRPSSPPKSPPLPPQTLRARHGLPHPQKDTGRSTSVALVDAAEAEPSARDSLLARSAPTASPPPRHATVEALLDRQQSEQDALSHSILQMAQALKSSSLRFHASLEHDRDLLARVGDGVERTDQRLGAVGTRLAALQRATEGRGWWGRMQLYAMVYGLMVFLLLLVFVLPKFRF